MEKESLIIIAGPTAVGKSNLAIELAKRIGGEIISADSMQVYRYMNIGTAKITEEEMSGVRHYLIDALLPSEEFSVAVFQEMVKDAILKIRQHGKIPILVGGTGFYIQAVYYGIDFTKEAGESSERKKLLQLSKEKGAHYLHQMLMNIDPASAEAIHENNKKRVIRAIEYFQETGERISDHNERERKKESIYQAAFFVLNDKREVLYEKIEQRVDQMIHAGLEKEVQKLLDMGYTRELVSMQGLGYKEMISYLMGEISLEEAIYLIKRDTRHFAKRQITWFKREPDAVWIDKDRYSYDNQKILAFMCNEIKNKGIC